MNLHECILTANACYIAGKTITPKGVMVHSTGANNPTLKRYVQPDDGLLGTNSNGNHWNQSKPDGTYKCVHAFIGQLADGSIATYKTLPWNRLGWHGGSGSNGSVNNTHIGFEICEDALADATYFGQVYQEAVELTAYLCTMYGLDPTEDGVVICHSEGCTRGVASNHSDVMHWFPSFGKSMDTFRVDVKNQMEDDDMDVTKFKALWTEMRQELQDNDSSSYSEEARAWIVSVGLMQGGGDGNMMWEDVLTREQMAVLLFRFAQLMGQA